MREKPFPYRQIVQTQIRCRIMRRLIRIFRSPCLQYGILKFEIPPNIPKIRNGLVLLTRVGKSIRLKWVKEDIYKSNLLSKRFLFLRQVEYIVFDFISALCTQIISLFENLTSFENSVESLVKPVGKHPHCCSITRLI